MAASRRLHVPPDSELSFVLHEALASGEPVIVEAGDTVYRLGVESAQRAAPVRRRPSADAVERSRAGIREAAGSWRDIDADAFKAYIRERRRVANRPSVEL